MTTIEVQKIKVSVAMEGSTLPRGILPPEGAPGSSKAMVDLQLKAGDILLTASIKAKSYREVLNKVDASPHGAFAVLQGQLGPGGELSSVGFTVQPIAPKDPQPGP
jgi:hypothetical protein